jgi:hypothetical protein
MSRNPTPSPASPRFAVVPADEAQELMQNANGRRDWSEVKVALRRGSRLFLTEDQLPASGVKYLSLSFARKQMGRTLHVRRVTHEGKKGRLIWLGPDATKQAQVPA